MRRESPAIWKGAYRTLHAKGNVLLFERRAGSDRVLVAVIAATRQP